jgi:alkylation response protein AidB-like acyl-CoA dehydrogenase
MDFGLSEDQEMLKTMARDLLEKEYPEAQVRAVMKKEEGYSTEMWKKIADLGWLGILYPEKYGGTGGNLIDTVVLFEEMGRAMYVSPFLSTAVLCGRAILDAGTETQKNELLPKLVKGQVLLAMALSEPEGVWDHTAWEPEGIKVKATAADGGYVINGVKLFVHDAHVADYLLVVTRTKTGRNSADGITLFLVNAKSEGIKYELLKTLSGNHKQSEVVFKDVKVGKQDIVGELHKGWKVIDKVLKAGVVMLCAEMLGAGQKVLEIAVDYAKTRIQFDMPIGLNQYVQGHCIRALAYVDTSRHLTYQAAWLLSEGQDCDMEVSMAKSWVSEGNERICWHGHQVLAGVGSTDAAGTLPIYTRLGTDSQYYLGGAEYHLEKVADEVEKLPPPDRPKGKALGLWKPGTQGLPSWDIWKEYYQKKGGM